MRNDLHAVEVSDMRRAIARRMTDSKQRVPHVYLSANIDMESCTSALSALNARRSAEQRISLTAVLVHSLAAVLPAYPTLNAVWDGDVLLTSDSVNIGVAIEVPDGLIAPAILGCERLDLSATAAALRSLVARARAGKVRASEWTAPTFTLSNLGMFEVDEFAAIIVPPQVAILAVGRIAPRPVVRDSAIVGRKMMTATLSADHRVADGALGGRFLRDLSACLQSAAGVV